MLISTGMQVYYHNAPLFCKTDPYSSLVVGTYFLTNIFGAKEGLLRKGCAGPNSCMRPVYTRRSARWAHTLPSSVLSCFSVDWSVRCFTQVYHTFHKSSILQQNMWQMKLVLLLLQRIITEPFRHSFLRCCVCQGFIPVWSNSFVWNQKRTLFTSQTRWCVLVPSVYREKPGAKCQLSRLPHALLDRLATNRVTCPWTEWQSTGVQ